MRRLLLILAAWALAFAPSAASAQGLLLLGVGAARTSGGGGGGYTGPGDIVSGAKAFYGLRAYSAAVAASGTQKAVRLTRASDSHQCDVVIATSGDLANVVSGCSATGDNGGTLSNGSTGWADGTTVTVNTWYDQTVNGFNASNGTLSAQPVLTFSCVGTRACAVFNGSTTGLTNTITATAQTLTISAVAIRTSGTTQADIFSDGTGVWFGSANSVGGYFGSSATVTATDSTWHALQFLVAGSSSSVNVDGTANTGIALGASALDSGALIGRQSSGSFLNGKISEITVWASGLTPTQQGTVCHNQAAYFGITASC